MVMDKLAIDRMGGTPLMDAVRYSSMAIELIWHLK
jgi:hypothetical protein